MSCCCCCCDSWQLYRHMPPQCGYKTQCYSLSHLTSLTGRMRCLCVLLETCRGSDNDRTVTNIGKMYSLSTGSVDSVSMSSLSMMSWEPIWVWVWDIGAPRTHDPGPSQSQSSFVRLDKVICFYPPWSESNRMIKWQSFMFHHLGSTITQQVCGKE